MSDISLFRFSNIPDEIGKALVSVDDTTRISKYKDEKLASAAYGRMRNRFKNWLLADNFVVLTGAGSSIVTGEQGESLDQNGDKCTGKSVGQIWQEAKSGLDKGIVSKLQEVLKEPDDNFNLERFISKLEMYKQANENDSSEEMKKTVEDCKKVRDAIIQKIKEECALKLHIKAPHQTFLRNVMTSRKRQQSRMQLFTLNYDTLFEQAAEVQGATILDGFSFTRTPVFNASNFELDIVRRGRHRVHHEENYEEKVFSLLKLHGSLEWQNVDGKTVRRQETVDDPLIIPPSFNKFEQSYQMPFFELMSRFQQTIRKENTTLLIIGYSFGDEHINRVVMEALASNLNMELIVVSPTVTKPGAGGAVGDLHSLTEAGQGNITLISDTFSRFTANMPTPTYGEVSESLESAGASENGETADEIPF